MELPNAAAIRIVENPHSMPHVPQNLNDIIAFNRREDALCSVQQSRYVRRRQRWDLERLQRISFSQQTIEVEESEDDTIHPRVFHRRSSSVIEHGYRRQLPSKAELALKPN